MDLLPPFEVVATAPSEVIKKPSIAGCALPAIQTKCKP